MVASDAAATPTTAVLKWTKIDAVAARNSELPSRRSGHTLSIIGSNGFLFGGCDYKEPPGPTNDLFVLRINTSAPCEWEKLKVAHTHAPLPRWKHSATVVDGKIYVFGGFHNSTTRFNDVWVFNPITMDWSQPGAQALPPTASTNASTASSMPTPSSSSATAIVLILWWSSACECLGRRAQRGARRPGATRRPLGGAHSSRDLRLRWLRRRRIRKARLRRPLHVPRGGRDVEQGRDQRQSSRAPGGPSGMRRGRRDARLWRLEQRRAV
ncbi:hypothetical protein PINS_up005187 [Pythium insidiosum]|nr:hypothetical protein PINS_up005187 [Pythium insidiosum]